jgi:NADH-quinone oxidoreductase subunit H
MDVFKKTLEFFKDFVLKPGETSADVIGPWLYDLIVIVLGQSDAVYHLVCMLIMALLIAGLVSVLGFGLIYLERKISARFQNRIGPNRVGPAGILQTVADTIKLMQKEDLIPSAADKPLFIWAPFISFLPAFMILAVIPFDDRLIVTDLNIGLLYITAVSGFSVVAILMAGWSSANKYSLLGGLRSAAQIISYELSPAMVILSVVLFSATLSTQQIVEFQGTNWNLWAMGPMGFIGAAIYLVASVAEINRAPFDLPEAESELTAGFSTEYSGMRFSMFYLSEFIHMFIVSALFVTMFLGGWQPLAVNVPWLDFSIRVFDFIPGWIWFLGKTSILIFIIMWFRWSFPRIRVDQLMRLEWKFLLPLSFFNFLATAVFVAFTMVR